MASAEAPDIDFIAWLAASHSAFPSLTTANCHRTSGKTWNYNCIAWAANCTRFAWWPSGDGFWPSRCRREVTLAAFIEVFGALGYTKQTDDAWEPSRAKIAIFTDANGVPKHAARQISATHWTSKMGQDIDISHHLRSVEGPMYGSVRCVLATKSGVKPLPGRTLH